MTDRKGYHPIALRPGTLGIEYVTPEDGLDRPFRLHELYDLLDCSMIEVVNLHGMFEGLILIVDEEGKLKGDPKVNVSATALAYAGQAIYEGDLIIGPAILCHTSYVN